MPRIYYGPTGENNSTYANAGNANLGRWELGSYLILPDQRKYAFALNDGTAEVAGNLYQSVAPVAGHTNRPADVVRAIAATIISGTLTTTAAADDIYAEGIVHINNDTGQGYSYRIRRANTVEAANADAVASGVLTVNLQAGETVQVAIDTTTELTFTRNRFHQVLITAAPPTGGLAGVSPGVAAADRFYWSQIQGYAAVLADVTLRAGLPVQASITVAGSVESAKRRARTGGTTIGGMVPTTYVMAALLDEGGTTTAFWVPVTVSTSAGITATYDISGPIAVNAPVVGQCIKANADTDYALVDLALQGT